MTKPRESTNRYQRKLKILSSGFSLLRYMKVPTCSHVLVLFVISLSLHPSQVYCCCPMVYYELAFIYVFINGLLWHGAETQGQRNTSWIEIRTHEWHLGILLIENFTWTVFFQWILWMKTVTPPPQREFLSSDYLLCFKNSEPLNTAIKSN